MDWLEGGVHIGSQTPRCLLEPCGEVLDLANELGLYLIKKV